jgi:pyruvate,water dikinase
VNPVILRLEDIRDEPVGGKAAGLAQLHAIGLRVPAGFAILGAGPDNLPTDLSNHYRDLGGGPVAVRSSALDEDGGDASFAGQYDTLLNVEGYENVARAVVQCLESLSGTRARAYRRRRGGADAEGANMCVVVQRMIEPRAAGVLFTVDPVSHRRAHAVIDAVSGLGNALVSGFEASDHYLLHRRGDLLRADLVGDRAILDTESLRNLLAEAIRAETQRGTPLDLEWAIDEGGEIWWLQARPITTLLPDLNELDTEMLNTSHVYTRCNVGEMFPGVCTPLSYSFTARGIDVGLQRMHMRVGVQDALVPEFKFIAMSYGHLFLNLTSLSDASSQTIGGDSSSLTLSLCGRIITDPEIVMKAPPRWPRRLKNLAGYFGYMFGQRQARRSLKGLVAGLHFAPRDASAGAMWRAIDDKFSVIFDAMDWHLVSSATSGIMAPILLRIVSRGDEPNADHHSQVAALLAGAEGVESADIAEGALRIQRAVFAQPGAAEQLSDLDNQGALDWLLGMESGAVGREFRRYLDRHGHRAIKELELRQPEWREDPLPLVVALKVAVEAQPRDRDSQPPEAFRGPAQVRHKSAQEVDPQNGALRGLVLRQLTRLAHQTVRSREETKSGLVAVTARFKQAYRELARRLVAESLLPDEDAVFFLLHTELGALVSGEGSGLARAAIDRRSVFDAQSALQFADVFVGEPVPIVPELPDDLEDHFVTGTSVSRGVVVGIARVVTTPSEAESLERGEILIAPITDVGWTPYFSVISGLVTDIGSAVSHGAVVAREFGLPAVVNTRFATQVFKSGDRIVLDANRGFVRLAGADDGVGEGSRQGTDECSREGDVG